MDSEVTSGISAPGRGTVFQGAECMEEALRQEIERLRQLKIKELKLR